jgi:hypothetical protein
LEGKGERLLLLVFRTFKQLKVTLINVSMIRPEFHKIYFPGLISVVCLLLMCIGYFAYEGRLEQLTALPVVWADEHGTSHFLKTDVNKFRKYDNEFLTGNKSHDSLVLADFEIKVRTLNSTTDTSKAYSITFSNHANYNEIVKTIDVCENSGSNDIGFVLCKDKALIWKAAPYHPPKNSITIDNAGLLADDTIIIPPPKPTEYDKVIIKLTEVCNEVVLFWPSIIVLLIMIGLSISRRRVITS